MLRIISRIFGDEKNRGAKRRNASRLGTAAKD
jgi:hypothetical protein